MRALLAVVVAALVALASASAGLRGAAGGQEQLAAGGQEQLAAEWARQTQACTIKGQMCFTPAGFMGLCTNNPIKIGTLQCSTVGNTKDYTAFTNTVHARATPNAVPRTNSASSRGSAHNGKPAA